jgi:hypothetical protein
MTKIKKSIKHDRMSIECRFESGASMRFSVGRTGETLHLAFSNDPAVLKGQMQEMLKWLDFRPGETNAQRFDRIEALMTAAKSGAQAMSLLSQY